MRCSAGRGEGAAASSTSPTIFSCVTNISYYSGVLRACVLTARACVHNTHTDAHTYMRMHAQHTRMQNNALSLAPTSLSSALSLALPPHRTPAPAHTHTHTHTHTRTHTKAPPASLPASLAQRGSLSQGSNFGVLIHVGSSKRKPVGHPRALPRAPKGAASLLLRRFSEIRFRGSSSLQGKRRREEKEGRHRAWGAAQAVLPRACVSTAAVPNSGGVQVVQVCKHNTSVPLTPWLPSGTVTGTPNAPRTSIATLVSTITKGT